MKVIKVKLLDNIIIIRLIVLFISLSFFSCKKGEDERIQNEEKSVNVEYWQSLSGFKDVRIIPDSNSNDGDSVKIFDAAGVLREKGLAKDTVQIGWWNYFNSKGNIIEKKEFLFEDRQQFINQQYVYTKDQKIDTLKSLFFTVNLDDTLELGKNVGSIKLNTFNKPYDSRYTYVIIKNRYENGLVQLDTFGSLNEDIVKFGVFAANEGNHTVEGEIYEEILLEESEVDSLNVSIDLVKIRKNFKKRYFVTDVKD